MRRHQATLKGPEKSINQDSVDIRDNHNYLLMTVADGLGSTQYGHIGSAMAVHSVRKAIVEFRRLAKAEPKVLIQLIHFFWNLKINDFGFNRKECMTTCLFVYIDKRDHFLISGQLGDGLIYLELNNHLIKTVSKLDDFNATKCLGSSKNIDDWVIQEMPMNFVNFKIMLLSDGLSEDLVVDKEKDFVNVIIDDLEALKPRQSYGYLSRMMKEWPTELHSDDKTICIAWERQ